MSFLAFISLSLSFLPLVVTFSPAPQWLFANPRRPSSISEIPSVRESAVLARRILNLSSIATLSTVFPQRGPDYFGQPDQDELSSQSQDQEIVETWPPDPALGDVPIGLMDYYAACDPRPWDPIILAISIATSFRNVKAGSNVSLSLRWQPPTSAPPSDDIYTYSPANMPRFSLIGYIESIPEKEVERNNVKDCFLKTHPDAKAWTPGNRIHQSWWGRLVVLKIYWIGGFGDRAYIGWIPEKEWRGATDSEIHDARLVGEDGYESRGWWNMAEEL